MVPKHIAEGFRWLAENQKGRGARSKWEYLAEDTYMPGNPYFMYVFARQLPQHGDQAAEADRELRFVGQLLYRGGKPRTTRLVVWEAMTFAMMSYAERLCPGGVFRTSR